MAIDISICPKCKEKYPTEHIECPNCGIIFRRYKKQQDDAFKKLLQSIDDFSFEEIKFECEKIVKHYPSLRGKCIKFLVALQTAMESMESKKYEKALVLFKEINKNYPHFKEAKRKISQLTENTENKEIQIKKDEIIPSDKERINRVIHTENFHEKLFIEYLKNINRHLPKNKTIFAYIFFSLLVGYFIGREHMKYEIKSVIIAGAEGVAKGLSKELFKNPSERNRDNNTVTNKSNKNVLPVEILEKKFIDDKYQDYIHISLQFKNNLNQNIRAYQGVLEISDVLENKIISIKLKHQEVVRKEEIFTWEGSINYNQFERSHVELRNTSLKDLNIDFFLNKVIYDDGSSETFN